MPASRVKLPLSFEPDALRSDLSHIAPDDWVPHFNTHYYSGDWSALPLRSIGGAVRQIYPDPTRTDFADTPILDRCPNLRAALDRFACPLLSVRLLKIAPGTEIREHRDYNLGYEDGEIRVHVPILTNPDVEFVLAGERVVMAEGESWYLNFNLPHRVANRGQTDRVHLVVDCTVNEWVARMLGTEIPHALTGLATTGPHFALDSDAISKTDG